MEHRNTLHVGGAAPNERGTPAHRHLELEKTPLPLGPLYGPRYPFSAQAFAIKFDGKGMARNGGAETARGVGVQLMLVLGNSIDNIRQQCANR